MNDGRWDLSRRLSNNGHSPGAIIIFLDYGSKMGKNPSTHMQTQALSPTGTRMAVLLGNEATTHPPSGLSTTNTYLLHRSGSNELLYDARLLGQISLDGLYVRAITLKA